MRQDSSEEMSFVASTLQGFGMTIAVNCFLLETILLILNISTSIYEAYVNWKNGIPRQKTISSLWVKGEGEGLSAKGTNSDIFDGDIDNAKEVKNHSKINRISILTNS